MATEQTQEARSLPEDSLPHPSESNPTTTSRGSTSRKSLDDKYAALRGRLPPSQSFDLPPDAARDEELDEDTQPTKDGLNKLEVVKGAVRYIQKLEQRNELLTKRKEELLKRRGLDEKKEDNKEPTDPMP